MAKEYIEREALMLNFESRYRDYRQRGEKPIGGGCVKIDRDLQMAAVVMKSCLDTLHDIPAADVVPVVRCRDCKYRKRLRYDGQYHCCNENAGMATGVELNDNDFCSYGERKDDDRG